MEPEPEPLVARALELLKQLEPYEGDRLLHVEAVARTAQGLGRTLDVAVGVDALWAAAWLHDIGYAPTLRMTGHHAIDGASYLRSKGWPDTVTSLVAHHSGAYAEAAQRGLVAELVQFPVPSMELADVLTLADLTCGPAGQPVSVGERLEEILRRYPVRHPVHRAVRAAAPGLRATAARAQQRLSVANS